jgi:erythromycin esterase-like protein
MVWLVIYHSYGNQELLAFDYDSQTSSPIVTASVQWLVNHARDLAAANSAIDKKLAAARVIFLGETDHFINEKVDFRLHWLKRAMQHRRVVIAEELGWSDGQRVNLYLQTGDDQVLDTLATFGSKSHQRDDRDDQPTGIFRASLAHYPHELMKRVHSRFYRALYDHLHNNLHDSQNLVEYIGFDIDAPGGAYEDITRKHPGLPDSFLDGLTRIPGETLSAEADRLSQLLTHALPDDVKQDLLSLIESLRYTELVNPAMDYPSTAPAMAYREESMKRRLTDLLDRLPEDICIVVMGHAFHLAKDDRLIDGPGIGPGGNQVCSLGHYLTQTQGLPVFSAWMLMGGGTDSQPLPDLPQTLVYPENSLNVSLRNALGEPANISLGSDCPMTGDQTIGHLYSLTANVHIMAQADAVTFFPTVTPLS